MVDVYLEQAEAYERLSDSKWDKALQSVAAQFTDHPFLAVRTREIKDGELPISFQRLVQAIAEQKMAKMLQMVAGDGSEMEFCNYCGAGVTGIRHHCVIGEKA